MAASLSFLLESCRDYLDLPLDRIRTFEPGHYTDPQFYDLEIRHIWSKEWINVGHVSEVPPPGDYYTIELIGEPMMILRGRVDEPSMSKVKSSPVSRGSVPSSV